MSLAMKPDNLRRKRVNLLKKVIITAVISAIIIPLVFCIILSAMLSNTRNQINRLEERLSVHEGLFLSMEIDSAQLSESIETSIFHTAIVDESRRSQPNPYTQLNEQTVERKIYLTFDDGPSSNTSRILDILNEYNIKATFFVVGKTDEVSRSLYRRIVDEGHTLGMHSFSHRYQEIYQSLDAFRADLESLQELLYEETGVWSRYYRFPGGSSNTVSGLDMQEFITYLTAQDIIYFDWNISAGDGASSNLSAQRIVANCLSGLGNKSEGIILLHDAAEKNSTVEALPAIIEGIKAYENTVILPISDDTLPIQHITVQ